MRITGIRAFRYSQGRPVGLLGLSPSIEFNGNINLNWPDKLFEPKNLLNELYLVETTFVNLNLPFVIKKINFQHFYPI